MKLRRLTILFGVVSILLLTALPAAAQKKVKVSFRADSNTVIYDDTVTGDGSVDYDVAVKAGQRLVINLSAPNKFLYFNVLDLGGTGDAIADNAREVTAWAGKIAGDATYLIRVYLVRAEARRNTTPAEFKLSIKLRRAGPGGGGGDEVNLDDLKGARASSGEAEMLSRGFRNVDSFTSGNTSSTVWWNGRTQQCIQAATVNGRYDSLTDIGTHPKCKDEVAGSTVGGFRSIPKSVSDLVGAQASSGEAELGSRGFRNVDGFKSGTASYTIWWNPGTRQCVQVATVDGKYDSVKDIGTHPKCK